MTDFLGTPGNSYDVHHQVDYERVARRFDADESGIIADVPPGNYGALLNMGAIPLPPPGWVDPRPVVAVK
jgi:hypothetical protein